MEEEDDGLLVVVSVVVVLGVELLAALELVVSVEEYGEVEEVEEPGEVDELGYVLEVDELGEALAVELGDVLLLVVVSVVERPVEFSVPAVVELLDGNCEVELLLVLGFEVELALEDEFKLP